MAETENRRPEAKAASTDAKTCAICGKPRDTRYDPFCSKRCADVDLHRWLSGVYVVPGAAATGPESEDEE
jgi:hypothetical protein